jgi:hypothetical protein
MHKHTYTHHQTPLLTSVKNSCWTFTKVSLTFDKHVFQIRQTSRLQIADNLELCGCEDVDALEHISMHVNQSGVVKHDTTY